LQQPGHQQHQGKQHLILHDSCAHTGVMHTMLVAAPQNATAAREQKQLQKHPMPCHTYEAGTSCAWQ
jgi:hypothetical protein